MDLKLYKLDPDTAVYRYISLSQFLAFIEKKKTYLTNISVWDDPHEDIVGRLPVNDALPKHQYHAFRNFDSFFGQSWSLNGNSDAMWKIYSKNNEGLLIKSTIKKFSLIQDIELALFGKIIYYNDLKEGLTKMSEEELKRTNTDNLKLSLLKRKAFEHEDEVRFITSNKHIKSEFESKANSVELDLDPQSFLENIIIDPRAPDWYVDTLEKYCAKNEIGITPVKSKLYTFDQSNLSDLEIKFYG